jgi:sporulation protein YlmC with PRC-barrel domain
MTEIKVELLLGAKVRDANGENVGRIEEIRIERTDNALLVEAFLIGASAVVDRLSAWTLVRPIKGLLKSRHIYSLYDVPWQDMDLSDPTRPVLRTAKRDLHHAR